MQASADVEEGEASVISSHVGETSSGADPEHWTVTVLYRWMDDGETDTNWSMCPGAGWAFVPPSDSRSDMEELLEDYQEGANVTAYVSPGDPSEAYLIEKDPSLIYLGVSAFGLVFVLLGVKELRTG